MRSEKRQQEAKIYLCTNSHYTKDKYSGREIETFTEGQEYLATLETARYYNKPLTFYRLVDNNRKAVLIPENNFADSFKEIA